MDAKSPILEKLAKLNQEKRLCCWLRLYVLIFQVFSIATSSGFDLPKTDFTNRWAIKLKKKKIETDMTNKAAKPKKKVSKKVTKTPKMVKAFIRRK